MHTGFLWGNVSEGGYLEDPDVCRRRWENNIKMVL
jgi:hypothetical protein